MARRKDHRANVLSKDVIYVRTGYSRNENRIIICRPSKPKSNFVYLILTNPNYSAKQFSLSLSVSLLLIMYIIWIIIIRQHLRVILLIMIFNGDLLGFVVRTPYHRPYISLGWMSYPDVTWFNDKLPWQRMPLLYTMYRERLPSKPTNKISLMSIQPTVSPLSVSIAWSSRFKHSISL